MNKDTYKVVTFNHGVPMVVMESEDEDECNRFIDDHPNGYTDINGNKWEDLEVLHYSH